MDKKWDNSGSIGKNTRKQLDKHPDISGQAMINGVEYWVSGWRKEGENGPWYSLAFKPKEEKPSEPKPTTTKKPGPDFDDDIPF